MTRKKIVILGAGISGLSTAWFLRQTRAPLDIVIVEKSSRPGGLLHTDHTTGFHFEKGPRTFKSSQASSILRLITELDLQNEVVRSDAKGHDRYLWHQEELHRFPSHPLGFCFSPLTRGFVKSLFTEWKQPPKLADETVWEFALRRFNYDVARLFFDPLVVGIFGGDIRQISVKACFPLLKAWEAQWGSITQGYWHYLKEKKGEPTYLFSLKQGVEQLVSALVHQTGAVMAYNQEVKDLAFSQDKIEVTTDQGQFEADLLFNALPAKETGLLFQSHCPTLSHELLSIHSQGIVVVSVGYEAPVLPVEGFGYLTATDSHEDILGVVFDSSVCPEHNRTREETRLTIKLKDTGCSEDEAIAKALQGIRRHLGISRAPRAVHVKRALRAIPQYCVGHLEKMHALDQQFMRQFPNCRLVGNYLTGVSVDACIDRARKAVQSV